MFGDAFQYSDVFRKTQFFLFSACDWDDKTSSDFSFSSIVNL